MATVIFSSRSSLFAGKLAEGLWKQIIIGSPVVLDSAVESPVCGVPILHVRVTFVVHLTGCSVIILWLVLQGSAYSRQALHGSSLSWPGAAHGAGDIVCFLQQILFMIFNVCLCVFVQRHRVCWAATDFSCMCADYLHSYGYVWTHKEATSNMYPTFYFHFYLHLTIMMAQIPQSFAGLHQAASLVLQLLLLGRDNLLQCASILQTAYSKQIIYKTSSLYWCWIWQFPFLGMSQWGVGWVVGMEIWVSASGISKPEKKCKASKGNK